MGTRNERSKAEGDLDRTIQGIMEKRTINGAAAFNINAGTIRDGKLADLMLIDLDVPAMVVDHNPVSNLVYAADSSCVDTVICNGRILMQNRIVPGEKEIIAEARAAARMLLKR